MAASFSVPMSICVQRRNPVIVPRRDILIVASDTPTLSITVYQQDTDTAPLDVTGAMLTCSIYRERDNRRDWGLWDYSFCHDWLPYVVATYVATPIDPVNGRMDLALSADPTRYVLGRYIYQMTMSYAMQAVSGIGVLMTASESALPQGNYTILRGIVDFAAGATVPLLQPAPGLLDGIGVAI